VKRYVARYQQTGKVAATVQGRMQARLGEAEWRVLEAELRAQPDATRASVCRTIGGADGHRGQSDEHQPGAPTVGVDAKKKTVVAREGDPLARRLFADVVADLPAERVIVVDETSTQRDMHPRYAWAPRGERAVASAARNTGSNVSVIASLSLSGLGPALALEGAVNTAVFLTYIRDLLVPTLRPGDIVVLDNLGCHKADAVRLALEAVGARLLFLPAYSPDFRPSSRLSANLKPACAASALNPLPICSMRCTAPWRPFPSQTHLVFSVPLAFSISTNSSAYLFSAL